MDAFMFIKMKEQKKKKLIYNMIFFLIAKNIIYDSATEKKCVLYEMNQDLQP